ncbi:MAG: PDZ domain-containing protein [Parvularculaceae bacterium]
MTLRRLAAALLISSAAATNAFAEDAPVSYAVSFPNAVHHEAEIAVTFREVPDGPFAVRMARSSPGRYALHEFAKNVHAVSAIDAKGQPLGVTRRDPYSWIVAAQGGEVTMRYTLYADHADGTYSQIDATHAHLNMPSAFMFAETMQDRPIDIAFKPASRTWKAATQLFPAGGLNFTAPNLQYFMDSPTELANFDMREWKIGEGKAAQTIRLAVHHDGERSDVDTLAEKTKKIVAEHIETMGEAPRFDGGTYTFIADYLPYATGDGMEHRNSTIVVRSQSLYEGDFVQLDTIAHEFFHAWNVERIRPAELEPFDFTRANPTPSLWFAEGFTNYFGDLAMIRSGERSLGDYLDALGGTMTHVVNSPGRIDSSPMAMSLQAAFVDAARAIDPTNNANEFISYYPYGEIIALTLDLTLRQTFDNVTLDDYMRYMWREYGKTEKPYTHENLRAGLAAVTGDDAFAKTFFADHIESGSLPDFAPLFAQAGLKYETSDADKASLGPLPLEENGEKVTIAANTIKGSPAYIAGLDRGDEIVKLGRFKIKSKASFEKALARHKPGETVRLIFLRRGDTVVKNVTFTADQSIRITPYEDADMALTEEMNAFRLSWLGVASGN